MNERLQVYEDKMKKTIGSLESDLMTIRAGRANPNILHAESSAPEIPRWIFHSPEVRSLQGLPPSLARLVLKYSPNPPARRHFPIQS